jgi:hypothetical protein
MTIRKPRQQGRYNIKESWQRAQSNPRMGLEWTYSKGAARNSCSSMNKMYIGVTLQCIEKKRLGCRELQYNSLFTFLLFVPSTA